MQNPEMVEVGKMLDGSCATHAMKAEYSDPVQTPNTFCTLLAKRKLLKLTCVREGCDHELISSERNFKGEERYRLINSVRTQ